MREEHLRQRRKGKSDNPEAEIGMRGEERKGGEGSKEWHHRRETGDLKGGSRREFCLCLKSSVSYGCSLMGCKPSW